MRTSLKKLGGAIAAASLLALGAPALSASADGSGSDDSVLRIANASTVDSLNPFISTYQAGIDVIRLEYEPLTYWDLDYNSVGLLADDWSVSEDGTTWTYQLKSDLTWSDGEPITSEDVKWTIEVAQQNDALQSANGSLMEAIASVSTDGEDTVSVTTSEAQAFDPMQGLAIVPKHVWEELDDPADYPADSSPVVSGPYSVSSYKPNQSVTMEANPKWHGGVPGTGKIVFVAFKDSNAAIAALKAGDIDAVNGMSDAEYQSLADNSSITTVSTPAEHYWSINVNPGAIDADGEPMGSGHQVLQDQQFRQAIQEAIDNQTLLDKVLRGHGTVGPGIIPPAFGDWYLSNDVTRSPSTAEITADLEDAGYAVNSDGDRLDQDGEPITLTLTWNSDQAFAKKVSNYVIPWLEDLGIGMDANPTSGSEWADALSTADYDLIIDGWGVEPDPDFMLYINTCDQRPNADGSGATTAYHWCNPDYDELYESQHTNTDHESRMTDVQEALGLLYDSAVVDVLFYDDQLNAYNSEKFEIPGAASAYKINSYASIITAKPTSESAQASAGEADDSGLPTYAWILIIVGAAVVIGGAVFLIRRPKSADRE